MSIQSEINFHVSEAGFFNKSINIYGQRGSAEIPDGAHIRFFNCQIDTITCLGENSYVYINGGTINKFYPSAGEYHLLDVESINEIDVYNIKAYIEGSSNTPTSINRVFKSNGGCRFEMREIQFNNPTLFDCNDTSLFLINGTSSCTTGGKITRGRIRLENLTVISDTEGITFEDKCVVDVIGGLYDTLTEHALYAKDRSILYCEDSILKGYLYSLKATNHSKVDCDSVVFQKNRNDEYHYSLYIQNASSGRVSNVGTVLGTDTPAFYVGTYSQGIARNCQEIKSTDSNAVKIENYSTFEGYNITNQYYSEKDDAVLITGNSSATFKKFEKMESRGKNGLKVSGSRCTATDFDEIICIRGESGILLENSQCDVSDWRVRIKGGTGIAMFNSSISARDGSTIIGLNDGVYGSNCKGIFNNVSGIYGEGNNGIYGTDMECSLIDVDNTEGQGNNGIEISTGRLFVTECQQIKGINNGIISENCDFYGDTIQLIKGEGEKGLKVTGTGKEAILRTCEECIGVEDGFYGEDVYGLIMDSKIKGSKSTFSNSKMDITNVGFEEGDVEVKNSVLDLKSVKILAGDFKSEDSHNFHDDCEYEQNIEFDGSLEEVNNSEIKGNIEGSPTLKINSSKVHSGISCTNVIASETEAATWEVETAHWQNCEGAATSTGACEKFFGGMTVNGFSAEIIRYANGVILDLGKTACYRMSNGEIIDYAPYIDHDEPIATIP